MENMTVTGASGAIYNFGIYQMSDNWNPVPVIYIFAHRMPLFWKALYVGESENAKDRFCTHERWNEAVRLGATHVLALVSSANQADRQRVERDLIGSLCPPMNVQHQSSTLLTSLLRA
ncbi:MAG: hypothetical protein JO208_11525 [Alphaproteobacteria bacterium]|nr:hypothetical protein [Alphaproteobacteria bacterium]